MKKIYSYMLIAIGATTLYIHPSFIMYNKKKIFVPREYMHYPHFVEERLTAYNPTYSLPIKKDMIFNPLDLITWWRFDIVAKYLYAYHREHGVKSNWAHELYAELLHVWGGAVEWDGTRNSLQEYFNHFHAVIDSIKTTGFNPQKSKIRIDNRQFPCEGAHRIASALLYNKHVTCYYNPDPYLNDACQATATFFEEFNTYVKTGLHAKYLDAMALQYCELKNNTRFIIAISPENIDSKTLRSVLRAHGNIIYNKSCMLTNNGIENLAYSAPISTNFTHRYKNLKNISHNLSSAASKTIALTSIQNKIETTWPVQNSYYVNVFLFEPREIEKVGNLENILCTSLKYKNQNFYVCSDYEKTVAFAQTFFVQNSLDHINNSPSAIFNSYKDIAEKLKFWAKQHQLDISFFCIDLPDKPLTKTTKILLAHDYKQHLSGLSIDEYNHQNRLHAEHISNTNLSMPTKLTQQRNLQTLAAKNTHHNQASHIINPITIHYHGNIPTSTLPKIHFIQTTDSDDVIFNPSRHFYHDGIKFISHNKHVAQTTIIT